MNCPTRVDPEALPNGWNQNPDIYATPRGSDTDSTANKLKQRSHRIDPQSHNVAEGKDPDEETGMGRDEHKSLGYSEVGVDRIVSSEGDGDNGANASGLGSGSVPNSRSALSRGRRGRPERKLKAPARGLWRVLCKYAKFVGPGWMVSVAYIDPGQSSLYLARPIGCSANISSNRQLCHRRGGRLLVSLPSPCHDPSVQYHSHIPPILVRQARLCHRAQPG